MTTCNKSLASFFFLSVLLCLCTCLDADAWTTNVYGDYQISYDELDDWWAEVYSDYTGRDDWPGLSDWCNTLPEISACFRNPRPHIVGPVDSDLDIAKTNGFVLASLSPRNYLSRDDILHYMYPEDVPNYDMLSIADKYNLVDDAFEAIVNVPNVVTNDANFPWRVRIGEVDGMRSSVSGHLSALLFRGVTMEVKTVPYGWSGGWAGWYISVCELIDNGVHPSVFGELGDMCDEHNVLWITDSLSIFGAFSNISLNVTHRWSSPP